MRNTCLAALIAISTAAAGCGGAEKAEVKASPSPAIDASGLGTEDEKALYAMGYNMSKQSQLDRLQTTAVEADAFSKGVRDAMAGTLAKVDVGAYDPKIQAFLQARQEKLLVSTKEKGSAFQVAAAAEAGAVKLASGVVFRTISPGTGAAAAKTDSVRVHYVGTFVDGTQFDASKKDGKDGKEGGPVTFQLSGVVPCFSEGISRMKVGEKARLVCPPETAYGDGGRPGIPGGSTLVFDIDLVDIVTGAKAAAPAAAGKPAAVR